MTTTTSRTTTTTTNDTINERTSGQDIYSALLANANRNRQPTPTSFPSLHPVLLASPNPTAAPALPTDLGSDEHSKQIYAALAKAAEEGAALPAASSTTSPPLAALALDDSFSVDFATLATTDTLANSGFLSNRLGNLVSPVPILVGVVLLLLGLFFAAVGARSMIWGNHWGKKRGYLEGRAHVPGGLGGVIAGAVGVGTVSAILTLVVVSHQSTPSLGSWGTLAILFCTSLLGAALGGRYRWAARAILSCLSSLSLTLLLTASFRLSSLLPRLIILAVLLPISLILSILPSTTRSLTIFSPLFGSFLVISGIDIFLHLGFLDLPSLLVSSHGVSVAGSANEITIDWNSATAKGLVAGWWLLAIGGSVWQWWWGGESGDADETWNAYLSQFVDTHSSSLGTFSPPQSFLRRLFKAGTMRPASPLTDIPRAGGRRRSPWDEEKSEWDEDAETIAGSVEPAKWTKYAAEDEELDSGDEGEKESMWGAGRDMEGGKPVRFEEFGGARGASGETFVGLKVGANKVDHGEEGEDEARESSGAKGVGGTMRAFLGKSSKPARYGGILHDDHDHDHESTFPPSSPLPSSESSERLPTSPRTTDSTQSFPANAVPATPSLIIALKRVSEAHRAAKAGGVEFVQRTSGEGEGKGGWEAWWGDVVEKAERK